MEKKIKSINQLHPVSAKKIYQDKLGNDRNKLWFKSGNSTMLFTEDITKNAAKVLCSNIEQLMKQMHVRMEGQWIITK